MSDKGFSIAGRADPRSSLNSSEDKEILKQVLALLLEHQDKFGSNARLASCVANVLTDALSLADSRDHKSLSRALAPVVVGTVRTEIWNAKDELVQALYPLAGQLISGYVASSIAGLLNRTDQRLRHWFSLRRAGLRIRSLVTGEPYRKLRLAYQLGAQLDAVLVVRRGSGIIIDEWVDVKARRKPGDKAPKQSMIAGMLAAMNEFANQALAEEDGALRTLDLGGSHVHLRATPSWIVAVKCSGHNSRYLDNYLDEVLLDFVQSYSPRRGNNTEADKEKSCAGLAEKIAIVLENKLLDPSRVFGPHRPRPVFAYLLFGALGIVAASMLTIVVARQVKAEILKRQVSEIILADNRIVPSQVQVAILDNGRTVALSGVMPSKQAAQELAQNIQKALGDLVVTQQFLYALTDDLLLSTLFQTEKFLGQTLTTIPMSLVNNVLPITTDALPRLLDTLKAPTAFLSSGAWTQLVSMDHYEAQNVTERAIASGLSTLPKIDEAFSADTLGRQDLAYFVSGSQPSGGETFLLPIRITDQGVKVSLFSTGNGDGGIFSSPLLGLSNVTESEMTTASKLVNSETPSVATSLGVLGNTVQNINEMVGKVGPLGHH